MEGTTRHARFLDLLDEVDRARTSLESVLGDLATTTEATRRGLLGGGSVSAVHAAGRLGPVRKQVADRLTGMNSALMHARAEGIRLMVDEEGMSLRDVARLIGHSRQFVSRLYHHARDTAGVTDGPDGPDGPDED